MLHYTDELRAGSANETLSYRPASNGKLINDPEMATISIYDPTGKICLIENASLSFNAQSSMQLAPVYLQKMARTLLTPLSRPSETALACSR